MSVGVEHSAGTDCASERVAKGVVDDEVYHQILIATSNGVT